MGPGLVLQRIALLEHRMGDALPRALLEPFPVDVTDVADLQRAGRRIAEFVGLSDLTFVITPARQREHVAGHVELDHADPVVFIEISPELAPFPAAALATLAHEISHKLLHRHHVYIGGGEDEVLDNEQLTDIAAVHAGLGKLMLEGCEVRRFEDRGDSTVEHRWTGGYVPEDELALTHLLSCALSDVADEEVESNLGPRAMDAIERARRDHLDLVVPRRGDHAALRERAERVVRDQQVLLAGVQRDVTYLRDHLLPALEAAVRGRHRELHRALGDLQTLDEVADDRRRYLATVKATYHQQSGEAEAYARASELNVLRRALGDVVDRLAALPLAPARTAETFRVVACPVDGTRLRLPPAKRVVARCPTCAYRFSVDTTVEGPARKVKRAGGLRSWFSS